MERDVNLFLTGLFGLAVAILLLTHATDLVNIMKGTAAASGTFLSGVGSASSGGGFLG